MDKIYDEPVYYLLTLNGTDFGLNKMGLVISDGVITFVIGGSTSSGFGSSVKLKSKGE